jgi:hypothetical protein
MVVCWLWKCYYPEKHHLVDNKEELVLGEPQLLLILIKASSPDTSLHIKTHNEMFKNKVWEYKKVWQKDAPQSIP